VCFCVCERERETRDMIKAFNFSDDDVVQERVASPCLTELSTVQSDIVIICDQMPPCTLT